MIFLLVFDIDVCSGMVAARFISITPLTHLKNLNNTEEDLHTKLYNIVSSGPIVGVIAPHWECCRRTKDVSVTGKMR